MRFVKLPSSRGISPVRLLLWRYKYYPLIRGGWREMFGAGSGRTGTAEARLFLDVRGDGAVVVPGASTDLAIALVQEEPTLKIHEVRRRSREPDGARRRARCLRGRRASGRKLAARSQGGGTANPTAARRGDAEDGLGRRARLGLRPRSLRARGLQAQVRGDQRAAAGRRRGCGAAPGRKAPRHQRRTTAAGLAGRPPEASAPGAGRTKPRARTVPPRAAEAGTGRIPGAKMIRFEGRRPWPRAVSRGRAHAASGQ